MAVPFPQCSLDDCSGLCSGQCIATQLATPTAGSIVDITVTGLQPSISYQTYSQAHTCAGDTEWSEPALIDALKLPTAPIITGVVRDPMASYVSATAYITVPSDGGCNIVSANALARPSTCSSCDSSSCICVLGTTEPVTTSPILIHLPGLEEMTEYDVFAVVSN